jgi:hypothetical protein
MLIERTTRDTSVFKRLTLFVWIPLSVGDPVPGSVWRSLLDLDDLAEPDLGNPFPFKDEPKESHDFIGDFPQLDAKQRKFAVNPSFQSYFDSRFKKIEGISDQGIIIRLAGATDKVSN